MKILKTYEELQSALVDEEIFPPDYSLNHLNKNKTYNCGCGRFHAVDSARVGAACRGRSIAHSGPGKGFILLCDTHATLVVTEGIFNYTFNSIWSAELHLFPNNLF